MSTTISPIMTVIDLPQCDVCAPRGFDNFQQAGEMAIYVPALREWLCAHCRDAKGGGEFGGTIVIPGTHRPGQPGYIEPGSPEWLSFITPSKVAAILCVSRWESAYRLWHRMKALVSAEAPKDIFDMGHDWEPAAANRWRRHNPGWRLSSGEVQIIDAGRHGFPFICTLDRRATRGRSRRVVEFKTARHMDEWGDDFTDACPEDYAAQCVAQMLFSGWNTQPAHMLVLGPYFNDHIYEIPWNETVARWILDKCSAFFNSLRYDEPPALDDSVATYECVRELHPDIDGTTVEVDADLAIGVHNASADVKAAEKTLRGLKTQLLDAMGSAESAVLGDPNNKNSLKVAKRSPHASGSVALNLARTHPAVQATQKKGSAA